MMALAAIEYPKLEVKFFQQVGEAVWVRVPVRSKANDANDDLAVLFKFIEVVVRSQSPIPNEASAVPSPTRVNGLAGEISHDGDTGLPVELHGPHGAPSERPFGAAPGAALW